MTWLLVALGAAVGAPLRYLAGRAFDSRFPLGTLLVNLVGSGVLGACSALALSGHLLAFWGVGFCGALTTFSSFAVQSAGLADERRGSATAYVVATIGGSLLACWLGFVLAA